MTATTLDLGARRDLYVLSSRLLAHEVDATLYRTLVSAPMDDLWTDTDLTFVEPALRAVDEEQALEALAVEYCRLFIGPLPPCIPYESSQREDALLGGKPRRKLEDFMERHGLVFDGADAVASVDHVAVELAMLAQLYGVAADETVDAADREEALKAVHELLSVHVLPWAPRFFAQLAASSEHALYRTVAIIASKLLDEERELHGL